MNNIPSPTGKRQKHTLVMDQKYKIAYIGACIYGNPTILAFSRALDLWFCVLAFQRVCLYTDISLIVLYLSNYIQILTIMHHNFLLFGIIVYCQLLSAIYVVLLAIGCCQSAIGPLLSAIRGLLSAIGVSIGGLMGAIGDWDSPISDSLLSISDWTTSISDSNNYQRLRVIYQRFSHANQRLDRFYQR